MCNVRVERNALDLRKQLAMDTIETIYDYDNDLTIQKVIGKPTIENGINMIEAYYAGKVTKYTLWDFSQSTSSVITNSELRKIIKIIKKHADLRRGGKSALVFNKLLDFGLGRMFETFAQIEDMPFELRSFRNMEKALEWLGISR